MKIREHLRSEVPSKEPSQKGKSVTFRAGAELAALIDAGCRATSKSQTELITEVIRSELPDVVRRILQKRRKEEDSFLKRFGRSKDAQGSQRALQ